MFLVYLMNKFGNFLLFKMMFICQFPYTQMYELKYMSNSIQLNCSLQPLKESAVVPMSDISITAEPELHSNRAITNIWCMHTND